jgi:hypothetical protein
MKPDTFSQYGYADATNLRALRRGYGHDIYPQYPTTYNMPRVVEGLGAFTKNNYTIPYYADPGSLSFADKNLKKLYEGLRNADADFQINLFKIKKAVEPAFGAIEFATAGKIRADDIKKALALKLPTWGVALVLEVAAGKRPIDKGFKSVMKECAKDMGVMKAAWGVITGLNGVLIGAAAVPSPVTPFALAALPVTGPLAGMSVTATTVSAILEPIFGALGNGKPPSRKQMKDMMEGAARLSGQKLPSTAEVDKVAADFDKAMKAAAAPAQAAISAPKGPNPLLAVKQEKQQTIPPNTPADTTPSVQTAASGFPVVPALLGVGALAAVILVARKRGKK